MGNGRTVSSAIGKPAMCAHVTRVPLALGPGHRVVGGIRVGQCERPALPLMVVCELHATPDAVRMVIASMADEIKRLKELCRG